MVCGLIYASGNYLYSSSIMGNIQSRLDFMLKWARTFVVRFDVRFPNGYPNTGLNTEISELMRRVKEHYTHHGIRCHYVWVREIKGSDLPHYHVVMMFDGHRINSGWHVLARVQATWNRIVQMDMNGLIHLCTADHRDGGVMLERPSSELGFEQFQSVYADTTQWLEYMAKMDGKGMAPKSVRDYQGSQLRCDGQHMTVTVPNKTAS